MGKSAGRSQWDVVVLELLGILEAAPPGAKDDRASEAANASCEMDNTCSSRKKHTQKPFDEIHKYPYEWCVSIVPFGPPEPAKSMYPTSKMLASQPPPQVMRQQLGR